MLSGTDPEAVALIGYCCFPGRGEGGEGGEGELDMSCMSEAWYRLR